MRQFRPSSRDIASARRLDDLLSVRRQEFSDAATLGILRFPEAAQLGYATEIKATEGV
jgi:hypothetical protein